MHLQPFRSVIPLLLILTSIVVLVATDADRSET
jgi:multisubunit Na+/H+ antiporter MnhC subunit